MEQVGEISEGEWNPFNGMSSEEAEFMAKLLGNCSLPNEVPSSSNFTASSTFAGLDETSTNMYSFSQGSSYSGGSRILVPFSSHESYYPSVPHQFLVTNTNLMTMDMMEGNYDSSRVHIHTNNAMEGDDFLNQDVSNDSVESDKNLSEDVLKGKNFQFGTEPVMPMPELPKDDKISSPSESKKRSRTPGEVQRNKKLKKCPKHGGNEDDNNKNNAVLYQHSSSCCCSEDDSNASHEVNGVNSSSSSKGGGALNLNGKTRASRGSATDPQSLYARKRRERINERLRILQNLVPNGTKVDISTMLEEAVQYVKFLQLQIKLLSSDDLWMYAPIAYSGMDIALDLKISSPKPLS